MTRAIQKVNVGCAAFFREIMSGDIIFHTAVQINNTYDHIHCLQNENKLVQRSINTYLD